MYIVPKIGTEIVWLLNMNVARDENAMIMHNNNENEMNEKNNYD